MNIFLIIVGLISAITGIALACYFAYQKSEWDEQTPARVKLITALCIVLGLCIFVFGFCFKIVPTGYTGVRTTFGQVSEDVVPQGFNFKIPFAQSIKLVNNKQQDTKIDEQVWGESKEKTPVYATEITVTYQVNPNKSAWIFKNVTDPRDLISQSIVSSSIKSAMVELPAAEVTIRSKIEPMVKEKLSASIDEKYGEGTITILKVVIDQMDFEESYNAAIAAKSIALQEQEKQKIENETAVARAEADKKVAVANAEAKAQVTRITAEAEAEATKITSVAEAEANKLLAESLTDPILKLKLYEKWNGQLPEVFGGDAVITDVTGKYLNRALEKLQIKTRSMLCQNN